MGVKPARAPSKPNKATSKSPHQSTSQDASSVFLNILPDAALLLDRDSYSIRSANAATSLLYGLPADALIGKDFLQFSPAAERNAIKKCLKAEVPARISTIQTKADGSALHIEFQPTIYPAGGERALLCILHDVSAHVAALRSVEESNAGYREILENASDIIYSHDLKGNFTSGNRAVGRLLGYEPSVVLSMNIRDVVVPEDLSIAVNAVQAKLQGRSSPNPYQLSVRRKDGGIVQLEVSTRLIYRDGVAVAVHGIARDISSRLRVESALRESESKFRAVAEAAPCAIIIYQGTTFKYVNPTTEEITGYSTRELLSVNQFWSLASPQYREMIRTRSAARLRGEVVPTRYEISIIRKDGQERWVDLTASNIQYEGESAALLMVFDITERKRAEEAVLKSEQLFRTVIESSSDIISIIDPDGTVRYKSPSVTRLLGYAPSELVGLNGFDSIHPDDRKRAQQAFQHGFTDHHSPERIELRLQHKDGSWRVFEAASNLLYDNGRPAGLLVSFRDMSERSQQQAELRASEERFRQLFERNLAGVYLSDLEGNLLDCNLSFANIYGFKTREEALACPASELHLASADRAEFIKRLRRSKSFTNLEICCVKQDGSNIWVLENVALLEGHEGEPERIQGTLVEITERKHAEQALTESESKFRAVADTAASAIYIHNGKRFLYVNRASQEISGYSAEELLNTIQPFQIVHPDDKAMVLARAQARTRGEKTIERYEYRILMKSGTVRTVDFSASTISFGGEIAILGTAFDITERKRVENLQAALYRISDSANTVMDLNKFFESIHGIVSELMYARNFYIALFDENTESISYPYFMDEMEARPEGSFPLAKGLTEFVLRTGNPVLIRPEDYDQLLSRGEVTEIGAPCIDWLGAPLRFGSRSVGVIALQSYTPDVRYNEQDREVLHFVSQHLAAAIVRKRNEDALRESESRYRSLVQSAVYGIYRCDAQHNLLEVNPALAAMLQYESPEQIMSLDLVRDVFSDADEFRRLAKLFKVSDTIENEEVKWKQKDRSLITVRLSGRKVINRAGKTQGFEMIAENVTERRALEEQLRQSQKMEAVGRLAGGVAHDFNNLLTVIKGYSELMLDELKDADPMKAEVEEIKKAADRAASLTRQLLAFSRQQVLAPKVLDLNQVMANMEKLLQRLMGEDVEFHAVFEPTLGRVKADPGQIEQVMMNLAVNARDAMPAGGKLTIETANVELDENYAREHVGAHPGSYVMLAVSDNGQGMTQQVKQRIFEPFFTTKELGKGTGLGLSTVYGIVKQSEGYVWVYSEVGVGTTFKVYLPRVDAPAEAISRKDALQPSYRGHETVLLVEDEDGVRALVRQVLHKHGYTVLEARHGGEAILHCERHKGEIQLLLTDVVLEQMGGPELAGRLAGIRPDMRVLYISGYTDDAIVQHGVLNPGTAFLQKPFTTEALAKKIRQVLEDNHA